MLARTLRDWHRVDRVAGFAEDGTLIRSGATAIQGVDGFFCRTGSELVQLYQSRGILKLFAHGREFDLSNPRLRAIYLGLPGGELMVLRDRFRPVLSLWHWLGSDALKVIADPTSDRIDFESERFLFACTRLINDKWRQTPTILEWTIRPNSAPLGSEGA